MTLPLQTHSVYISKGPIICMVVVNYVGFLNYYYFYKKLPMNNRKILSQFSLLITFCAIIYITLLK